MLRAHTASSVRCMALVFSAAVCVQLHDRPRTLPSPSSALLIAALHNHAPAATTHCTATIRPTTTTTTRRTTRHAHTASTLAPGRHRSQWDLQPTPSRGVPVRPGLTTTDSDTRHHRGYTITMPCKAGLSTPTCGRPTSFLWYLPAW